MLPQSGKQHHITSRSGRGVVTAKDVSTEEGLKLAQSRTCSILYPAYRSMMLSKYRCQLCHNFWNNLQRPPSKFCKMWCHVIDRLTCKLRQSQKVSLYVLVCLWILQTGIGTHKAKFIITHLTMPSPETLTRANIDCETTNWTFTGHRRAGLITSDLMI